MREENSLMVVGGVLTRFILLTKDTRVETVETTCIAPIPHRMQFSRKQLVSLSLVETPPLLVSSCTISLLAIVPKAVGKFEA